MIRNLTEREIQILKLIASGSTNKTISSILSIKESTVENHVHNIYIKLNITNRSQATAFAFLNGLILSKNINEKF